jgi:hypothetical protein
MLNEFWKIKIYSWNITDWQQISIFMIIKL